MVIVSRCPINDLVKMGEKWYNKMIYYSHVNGIVLYSSDS